MSSMNVDDFIAGIMSSMKLTHTDECPTANIEEKIVRAFNLLEQLAHRKQIELRFHCSLNPYTKGSATIHYGLIRAEQSDMLERDGQTVKIRLTVEEAATVINESPLALSEWKIITKSLKPDTFMTLTDVEQLETLYNHKA